MFEENIYYSIIDKTNRIISFNEPSVNILYHNKCFFKIMIVKKMS